MKGCRRGFFSGVSSYYIGVIHGIRETGVVVSANALSVNSEDMEQNAPGCGRERFA